MVAFFSLQKETSPNSKSVVINAFNFIVLPVSCSLVAVTKTHEKTGFFIERKFSTEAYGIRKAPFKISKDAAILCDVNAITGIGKIKRNKASGAGNISAKTGKQQNDGLGGIQVNAHSSSYTSKL